MSARDQILNRLRAVHTETLPQPQTAEYYTEMSPKWDTPALRLQHWANTMRKVKGEIVWCHRDTWQDTFAQVVAEKNIAKIVLPLQTEHGQQAAEILHNKRPVTEICAYSQTLEQWKDEFFNTVDAGFTDIKAGIAHTGTLLLWPTPEQPRTMSLVPPIHIALFDTTTLYDDFYAAMHGLDMADGMPTNVVLISGPSKTSDIQLTLAFGAHGPRDLVVLALLPDDISMEDVEGAA
ncbi:MULTISPECIES: LutC/YkgG family protein [Vitreoscilla]|uniref:Lactate utilization protein C n=1 Tax=Vitreoscilla stercoraria TaxID=61 RepID=A0ABY4E8M8_VITST|nr:MULTISPECIES: lactate utilization protein C [Vitreoscilla]AUZ04610.1 hypothetical protein ADP71_08770 [Vitreoscilla sp. C1]UOO91693.1 lactate utilization protein C [Vitreoscilla stercoraria]